MEKLVFKISQDKKLGYIDQDGNLLLQTDKKSDFYIEANKIDGYYGAVDLNKIVALKDKNGKYGFYKGVGQEVIKPAFDFAYDFINDRAVVGKKTGQKIYGSDEHVFGYIDINSNQITDFIYKCAYPFYEDVTINHSNNWMLIDKNCKKIKDLIIEHGSWFQDGLAKVIINGKYGFMDTKGDIVINPQFDHVADFINGVCRVLLNGHFGVIDKTGNFLVKPVFHVPDNFFQSIYLDFYDGLGLYEKKGKYGYIDMSGNIAIDPVYDNAWYFREGLSCVQIGNKCGYINTRGEMIIEPQFTSGWIFSEGLAPVQKKLSIIDKKTGKKVLRLKWGFINNKGEIVIEPMFKSATEFHDGMALVTIDDKWAYVNKAGKIIWTEKVCEEEDKIEILESDIVCKACRKKIEKRTQCFAYTDKNFKYQYFHLECAVKKYAERFNNALKKFDGELSNRKELAEKIERQIDENTSGFWKVYPYVELAKSGKSKCMKCDGIIEKDALRIAVEREFDTPNGTKMKGSGYLHLECATGYEGVSSIALLVNSRGLTDAEISKIKEIFERKQ